MPNMIHVQRPCKGVVALSLPTPFAIGDVNVYLLEGDPLTLVDTGTNTKQAWTALLSGIEAAGYPISEIRQIVLTHAHEDHAGLTQLLKQNTGAIVYAHPDTDVWLRNDPEFVKYYNDFYETEYLQAGVPVEQIGSLTETLQWFRQYGCVCGIDQSLAEGQFVPGHAEWQVVYTPGHSQTSLSLYRATDQTMILGDHLIGHMAATAFLEPTVRSEGSRMRVSPLIQYRIELQKLQLRHIQVGLSGHGGPVFQHAALIEKRLQAHERRAETLQTYLLNGEQTAFQLAHQLFPHRHAQLHLILSETVGLLEWMEANGRLQKKHRFGVDLYSV